MRRTAREEQAANQPRLALAREAEVFLHVPNRRLNTSALLPHAHRHSHTQRSNDGTWSSCSDDLCPKRCVLPASGGAYS